MATKRLKNAIENYWNKNKSEIISRLNAQNPSLIEDHTPISKYKQFFFDDVEGRMTNNGLSPRQAIKKTLASRPYKSLAEWFAESLKQELLDNKTEYNKVRDFYRSEKGTFMKWGDPHYEGQVEINGNMYKKYKYTKGSEFIFVYTSQSPKSDLYDIFVSRKDYV